MASHSNNNIEVEENDTIDNDRMDMMFDFIWSEFELDCKDPSVLSVQKFFNLLKASKDSLHEYITITTLGSVSRLMSIKFKFAFSNNCYKEVVNLIGGTIVTIFGHVSRLMSIKSKFALLNNCYKELVNLISDVLLANHKIP